MNIQPRKRINALGKNGLKTSFRNSGNNFWYSTVYGCELETDFADGDDRDGLKSGSLSGLTGANHLCRLRSYCGLRMITIVVING